MKCPRCGRKGRKLYQGYCTEVHMLLTKGHPSGNVRLFCAVCDRPILRKPSKVPKKGRAVCPRCSKNQGENHWNFKGARYLDTKGYVHILVGDRYVLEHRQVWQRANHATLVPWQPGAIHHINFNKSYNDPDNLLLLSNEEHSRVHKFLTLGRRVEAYAIMYKRACEQYHFPEGVKAYAPKVNQKKDVLRKSKMSLEPIARESDS